MKRHRTALLEPVLALFLVGCAVGPKDFKPYAPAVYDADRYAADETLCRGYAEGYEPDFDLGRIAGAAGTGALQNAPSALVAPSAVALGSAGSAGSEALEELGILTTAQIRVFVFCLKTLTGRDRSALVLDPNG